ncbi:MAG: bifunctional demethylmenaquinone methyltransferase/2-methoxy-6-polyprenyl-1,4-benzoquinol methylase UbiE [Pseudomonadota bacterium]|nr:bifunctional demethylmenaquinone methyltransferase/2-methoxy-6-polyprenyl-1,4-benzoquinol methylase UbiE [Pseudomonadota bacterium]
MTTDFGFSQVDEEAKAGKVAEIFHSVANRYDVMNDLMSGGLHRLWKRFAVRLAALKSRQRLLDIAGGSGDLVRLFVKDIGAEGELWLTDVNQSMLQIGRNRLINAGILCPALLCDAEKLPFPPNYFDVVTCAFGLRNMTHKDRALAEMQRVLRPGGRAIILEFSKVWAPLKPAYDAYSFNVLPVLGKFVARDEGSYRYLAESIRMHPDQETLKNMMTDAGFAKAEFFNLTGGVVAVHRGFKY